MYVKVPGSRAWDGPYVIASVPRAKTYTLSEEDGVTPVENWREFSESDLKRAE